MACFGQTCALSRGPTLNRLSCFQENLVKQPSWLVRRASSILSQKQRAAFDRDGFVVVRQCIAPRWIAELRDGVDANMLSPGPHAETLQDTVLGGGNYFGDYLNWKRIANYRQFILESNIGNIAADILGERALFYHEHVLVKDPGTFKTTPWHHDQPYYPINGNQVCSIWLPLDPVDEATSLQLLPGSHQRGMCIPRHFATAQNYQATDDETMDGFAHVPEIPEQQVATFDMQPGDALVFHMRTLHAAPANRLAHTRRVFVTRWLGSDATLATRPWQVSPPIDPRWQMEIGDRFMDCISQHEMPLFQAEEKLGRD